MGMISDARKFTLRELALMGVFGALLFFSTFVLGSAILMATGIPASGAIVTITTAFFILIIGAKIVDKFGAATVIVTLAAIFAIPTLTFGPPGLQKVPNFLVVGLVIDIVISLFQRVDRGYIIAGAITGLIMPTTMYVTMVLVGLPACSKS